MMQMLRIGIPTGVQFTLLTAVLMLTYRYLRPFSGNAAAAASIGLRIVNSAIFAGVAIGAAVASLSGQNYGALRYARVRSAVLWGSVYIILVFSAEYALMLANPRAWVALFSVEPGIVEVGASFLVITGLALPVYGICLVANGCAQGLGKTAAPLLAAAMRLSVTVLCLLALDLWFDLTIAAVFWVMALAMLAESACMAGVLVLLWRTVLDRSDGEPAAGVQLRGSPQPAPVTD
jgi:Na+-driven multidrug efflux pump